MKSRARSADRTEIAVRTRRLSVAKRQGPAAAHLSIVTKIASGFDRPKKELSLYYIGKRGLMECACLYTVCSLFIKQDSPTRDLVEVI
ncbi:hypothetical protein NDU88_006105 [Pleurodeles waltl]|uniref:Uncharacterized protein n=1 Tax=Pleurodeles waltl TaxID=8319 RepID=A0AAV7WDU9_PLEWA|nr:hypothetical protein NDU88_006105 [Pleurodeles waltl]